MKILQVILKDFSVRPVHDLGTSEIIVAAPLAKLARVIFIPDELSGISLSDNSSGSCGVTSDQLDPEWYVDMQIGKQWKMGPFSGC